MSKVAQISDARNLVERGSRVLREHRERMEAERAAQREHSVMPLVRAFQGGSVDRISQGWTPANTSINVDLESQLPLLRARSRSLWANTSFGKRFSTLVENNVVGQHGFQLQSSVKNGAGELDDRINTAIEKAFDRWSRPENCDVRRRLSFPRLCGVIAKTIARDGEVLVRKVRGRGAGPFGYQLQVLRPDRVDHHYNALLANGNSVRMGVEINTLGAMVAMHILSADPGDSRAAITARRERVLCEDCWLLFLSEDAEQLRGIPWAHAVLLDSRNVAGFEEAAIIAARAGASKFGWLKQNADADPEGAPEGLRHGDIPALDFSAGTLGKLPYGWDVGTFDPNYPSDVFDSFVNAVMHKLASGLDIAHHNLSGRMDGVSYSSARIAEMSERDNWRRIQQWMIDCWLTPMACEWLAHALLFGQVTTPSGKSIDPTRLTIYLDAISFDARGWDWVDPRNEVDSSNKAVEGGLDSRTSIMRRQGKDFDKVLAERKREERLLKEAGIAAPEKRAAASAPADPAEDPENKADSADGKPADDTTEEQS